MVRREGLGQPLVLQFGNLAQQETAEHAEVEARGSRQPVPLLDPIERLEGLAGGCDVAADGGDGVVGELSIESMKSGGSGLCGMELPILLEDALGERSKGIATSLTGHGRSRAGTSPLGKAFLRSSPVQPSGQKAHSPTGIPGPHGTD
ncbi:MAG: hypothetical protein E6K19_03325 [Methanobacteriota archaeon]|nr:MAG: hypothetical protein E6K19_03325 [Euryarchaeota archaeon]